MEPNLPPPPKLPEPPQSPLPPPPPLPVNQPASPLDPVQPVGYAPQPGLSPANQQPQFVHIARAVEPMPEQIPAYILERHAASLKKYPHLNLSKGEYIISAVKRHPIGIIKIWLIGLALIAAFMALYFVAFEGSSSTIEVGDSQTIVLAALAMVLLLIIGGTLIATYVYNANRFYLTNESVIQEIQSSLFSKHEQTVSLSNIEDASFKQGGILPMLFNYGTIRLSTEGDETTYRFSYVANPKKHIAVLNNAVEAFKNGRPVDPPNDDQPS